MKVSDYTYDLPDSLIADTPPAVRGTSRLQIVHRRNGTFEDRHYGDIVEYLEPGDVLVINDSKVIKARLQTVKANGAPREIVLLEKHGDDDGRFTHKVMYRRSLATGDILHIGKATLTVTEILGDGLAVITSYTDLLELAQSHGNVPLPPYMHRNATDADNERYQTVWADDEQQGSVAAPTASLNMTDETLARLASKGVIIVRLTLHVGLGTFLPIRVSDLSDHAMHQEYFEIPESTVVAIQTAQRTGHRVIALGTTVTRTLEYAADQLREQPRQLRGEADIFIYPGYEFKTIDGLLTNYHAPKSTVLMLTAAFAGWDVLREAYERAVREKYQFLSYGDSMLII